MPLTGVQVDAGEDLGRAGPSCTQSCHSLQGFSLSGNAAILASCKSSGAADLHALQALLVP